MLRSLTFIFLLLGVVACGSDEQGGVPYVAASVDGRAWRGPASDGTIAYSVDAPDGPGFVYSIASGGRGLGGDELLILDLPNPPALGVFPLGGDTAFATFMSCPTQDLADCAYWRAVASDAGMLEISAIDTSAGMIDGSFSFRGHFLGDSAGSVKSVTEGHFRIHFALTP